MQDQLHRHDDDKYAHREAYAEFGKELGKVFETFNTRLMEHDREISRLERLRWRVEGGLAVVAIAAGGGALDLLGHIMKLW